MPMPYPEGRWIGRWFTLTAIDVFLYGWHFKNSKTYRTVFWVRMQRVRFVRGPFTSQKVKYVTSYVPVCCAHSGKPAIEAHVRVLKIRMYTTPITQRNVKGIQLLLAKGHHSVAKSARSNAAMSLQPPCSIPPSLMIR